MIGKAGLGKYAKGILEYCYYEKELTAKSRKELTIQDVRGELIYIQHLGLKTTADGRLDIDYLAKQFLENMDKNRNLTKFMGHQSFSFPPGEHVSNEKITAISQAFAKEFGFEQNQMLVFKHDDTAHPHFHIVANRINYNGKNTADHFNNYARTGSFSRRMELELGLTITPDMQLNSKAKQAVSQDKSILYLKGIIDGLLPEVSSVTELKQNLEMKGIKTYIGRGIAFFDPKSKVKVKGSQIGRDYSLVALESRIGNAVKVELKPEVSEKQTQRKRKGLRI